MLSFGTSSSNGREALRLQSRCLDIGLGEKATQVRLLRNQKNWSHMATDPLSVSPARVLQIRV